MKISLRDVKYDSTHRNEASIQNVTMGTSFSWNEDYGTPFLYFGRIKNLSWSH